LRQLARELLPAASLGQDDPASDGDRDRLGGADDQDAWYLTALDFDTGRRIWRRLAGEGLGYNNNYAPVTMAPNGTAYVGVLGGLVKFRDAPRR
jgi:hypothetical protein